MWNLFKTTNKCTRITSVGSILPNLAISKGIKINKLPSLIISREIWKQILMAATLFPFFLNHLMEQIISLYAVNSLIMENVTVFKMENVFSRL